MVKISKLSKKICELLDKNSKRAAAIIKKEGFIKKINYFDYKYEIFSLCHVLKELNKSKEKLKVAIISENRYEMNIAYYSNLILGNKIYLIDGQIGKGLLETIIKKYDINMIFFSSKYENKILSIYKINRYVELNKLKNVKFSKQNAQTNNKAKLNSINKIKKVPILINFDSNSEIPQILNYEKILCKGKYLENYNVGNMYEDEDSINETTIINKKKEIVITEEKIDSILKTIKKRMVFKKNKIYEYKDDYDVTEYNLIIQILMPIYTGACVLYKVEEEQEENDNKIKSIELRLINVNLKPNAVTLGKKEKIKYKISNVLASTKIEKIKNDKERDLSKAVIA